MRPAAPAEPVALDLAGVPATTLLTLHSRAAAAGPPLPMLDDPLALGLVARIAFDFVGTFGQPHRIIAIRARFCDDLIRAFLGRHPAGTIVALGEGLETQLWRVDNGRLRWFSVDLPEIVAARRALLPRHDRNGLIACSAFEPDWFDAVAKNAPLFVTAAGLFPYFERRQVTGLLRTIGRRFPGSELFFDTVPEWFARKTRQGFQLTPRYRIPPMPFGLDLGALDGFAADIPGLRVLAAPTYLEPYPALVSRLLAPLRLWPLRNRLLPGLVHARFEGGNRV
jgi:O-methyltransferase involved in polyketide biosynthesis